jgi:hypothetical protein
MLEPRPLFEAPECLAGGLLEHAKRLGSLDLQATGELELSHSRHRLVNQIADDGDKGRRARRCACDKPLSQLGLSICSLENGVNCKIREPADQAFSQIASGPCQSVKVHRIDSAATDNPVFDAGSDEQNVARHAFAARDDRNRPLPAGKHTWHRIAVRRESFNVDRKHRRAKLDGSARHRTFRTFVQRKSNFHKYTDVRYGRRELRWLTQARTRLLTGTRRIT